MSSRRRVAASAIPPELEVPAGHRCSQTGGRTLARRDAVTSTGGTPSRDYFRSVSAAAFAFSSDDNAESSESHLAAGAFAAA